MARKKRSLLPAVTDRDVTQCPEMLRATAHGWAWKCAHCGQFASSETLTGKYVCRSHGGVTARQRDPLAREEARRKGKPVLRPPGRPLITGLYSKRPQIRIDEIVCEWQLRQIDVDNTDEDMLYLRAYIEDAKDRHAALRALPPLLEHLTQRLELRLANEKYEQSDDFQLRESTTDTYRLLSLIESSSKAIEKKHTQIIKMSKARAETRLKDNVGRQMDVFLMLLKRMMIVLEDQLSVDEFNALQQRISRDLAEVPACMLNSSVK